MSQPSRRQILAGTIAAGPARPLHFFESPEDAFLDISRQPDLVRAFSGEDEITLRKQGDQWEGESFALSTKNGAVSVSCTGDLSRVQLRWRGDLRSVRRLMGDHWERSYADLEWRSEAPNRVMPWYFMAWDGHQTHGYGVRTSPNAFCFWTADVDGISLWIDVRNGGSPVRLGGRQLAACQILCRKGKPGETPFQATSQFCGEMCSQPRLPKLPVYGTNDWNFAYGNNSADLILQITKSVSDLSSDAANRPYSVIDDGWSKGGLGHGPWYGNEKFGDMDQVAKRMKDLGAKPGIWFRPLTTLKGQPDNWRLGRAKSNLDPSIPETLKVVSDNISRLREWGFELLKHDYTSWDVMGKWGATMGASMTTDGWSFNDRTRTTAEILLDLYRQIREGAGDMVVIGCNTFSHLSAGLFELMRTGDDTSGQNWDRTRRMGVNTLAFRAAQHGKFYSVDPDMVAVTDQVPWELTERWLRLVSTSGVSLFVSIDPKAANATQAQAFRTALAMAAKPQPLGEPLDWLETMCPREWRLRQQSVTFDWMGPEGPFPLDD